MNVLDLFSGIGGFSLGLERAGMRTVYFCELDAYCRAVLAKHWPDVPCHDDIRTFPALDGTLPWIDVICGGFPCQDISVAGRGEGLRGERSGLWKAMHQLIGLVQPRYALLENVSALLHRGLGEVLGDLAEIGYDAEWHCIPAATVGAPHRRDRIWIVAYPSRSERWTQRSARGAPGADVHASGEEGTARPRRGGAAVAYADSERQSQPRGPLIEVWRWLSDGSALRDADSAGFSASGAQSPGADGRQAGRVPSAADWWAVEPDVGRMAHGIPARVDRLRALGNSIVPQIAEAFGRAIMKAAQL